MGAFVAPAEPSGHTPGAAAAGLRHGRKARRVRVFATIEWSGSDDRTHIRDGRLAANDVTRIVFS